jgi:acyl dehydratase
MTELTDEMQAWVGASPLVLHVHLDRKDVVRFAVATGETNPIHLYPAAAREAGFADVVAPPLFYVSLRTSVFNLVQADQLHEEGTPLRDIPPLSFTQAMAGETTAELHRPFVAGDDVTCSRVVDSVYTKQGRSGALTFIRFRYRYADADDQPFAVEHFTRIFR